MHSYKELKIWQQSMDLVVKVYNETRQFPASELYNLVSQINKSSVSIPSNIAEGAGRGTNRDFAHFLSYSQGSAYELETQLLIAQSLGFIQDKDVSGLLQSLIEIQKMNFSLQKSLQ